jgi:imidazolonepropionase-like amidohydrolase
MKLDTSKLVARIVSCCTFLSILATPAVAQTGPPTQILIKNVRIFDGTTAKLTGNTNLLVEKHLIKEISKKVKAANDATVIDGGGRVLIPGLIDTHQHVGLPEPYPHIFNNVDHMWLGVAAVSEARSMLMRGFTTVRDAGGPAIGLAQAIRQGRVEGPRIYPSGPGVFKTSGHGAFRNYSPLLPNIPGDGPPYLPDQYFLSADGAGEVLRAAREALQRGATQISVTTSAGAVSQSDASYATHFSVDEIRAAAQAATEAGTYVMVNATDDVSVRRALEAGIVSIDQGTLMTGKTMKLLKEKGGYLVPQARLFTVTEEDKPSFTFLGPTALNEIMQLNDALANQFGCGSFTTTNLCVFR